MFATFLGFWAAAAVWELAILGLLIGACLISSAGVVWRWEKGNPGDPGWVYTWAIGIALILGASLAPTGALSTPQGVLGILAQACKYYSLYLVIGLVYASALLSWTFIRGKSVLKELVRGLQNYRALTRLPSYSDLRGFMEMTDQGNESSLFAKYFYGRNAPFEVKHDRHAVMEGTEQNPTLYKLHVSDVVINKGVLFTSFLNNAFLWAALLPARIFMDWLVDFGRWVVETVSRFGLNYLKSALRT